MFVGGHVRGSTVSTRFASYHVDANATGNWVIHGKQSKHDSTTRTEDLLPFHYALMAGFYQASGRL